MIKSKPKERQVSNLLSARPAVRVGLLLLACCMLALFATRGLEELELKLYDVRLNLAANRHVSSSQILIVAVDDESLRRMAPAVGRWPWPRAVYAGLIDYMSGAKSISFDILFPEADWQFAESDDLFAEAVGQHGRIILGAFIENAIQARLEPLSMAQNVHDFHSPEKPGAQPRMLVPYPKLRQAAKSLGHVNIFPDRDGVVRRYPMQSVITGYAYPSLGNQIIQPDFRLGLELPELDENGFFLIQPYRDKPKVISAVDILSDWNRESSGETPSLHRSAFEGKHVLVGSLATGLHQDRRVTPWGLNVPGIFIAATAVNNMLDEIQIHRIPRWANLVVLLALSSLSILTVSATPLRQGLATLCLLGAFVILNILVFVWFGLWVDSVLPILAPFTFSVYLSMFSWYHELRRRRHLESLEQAKQAFTDMLVHDLKGRSCGILMASNMIQEQLMDTDSPLKGLVSSMVGSSQRLLAETSGLLDIRKMSEGKLDLRLEPFNVHHLLQILQEQNESTALIAGSKMVIRCDRDLLLTGDQDLLGRVVSNLIWNAVQHVKNGTDIILAAYEEGDQVLIEVHNEGNIIEPDRIDDLFLPFLSGAITHFQPDQRPTGLGLTFCKLAVEAHGGEVNVLSPSPEFSSGACFRLCLPRKP